MEGTETEGWTKNSYIKSIYLYNLRVWAEGGGKLGGEKGKTNREGQNEKGEREDKWRRVK